MHAYWIMCLSCRSNGALSIDPESLLSAVGSQNSRGEVQIFERASAIIVIDVIASCVGRMALQWMSRYLMAVVLWKHKVKSTLLKAGFGAFVIIHQSICSVQDRFKSHALC